MTERSQLRSSGPPVELNPIIRPPRRRSANGQEDRSAGSSSSTNQRRDIGQGDNQRDRRLGDNTGDNKEGTNGDNNGDNKGDKKGDTKGDNCLLNENYVDNEIGGDVGGAVGGAVGGGSMKEGVHGERATGGLEPIGAEANGAGSINEDGSMETFSKQRNVFAMVKQLALGNLQYITSSLLLLLFHQSYLKPGWVKRTTPSFNWQRR